MMTPSHLFTIYASTLQEEPANCEEAPCQTQLVPVPGGLLGFNKCSVYPNGHLKVEEGFILSLS